MSHARTLRWLVPLIVFAAALLPRLADPAPFITWDEPTWTYRSLKFARALQTGEPATTYLTAHPGVLTMWLGAAGVGARAAFDGDSGADLAWVDALPSFDEDDPGLLRTLTPWWPWSRAMIGLATALVVLAAYLLLVRLVGVRTAFVAALTLAFDPFLLAHSRVLHLDALLAGLLLLSVLATLVALRETHRSRYSRACMALAGALGAAAALEKSPALFIAPFTALLVGALLLPRRAAADGSRVGAGEATGRSHWLREWLADCVGALTWWGVGAIGAYIALWPAMWASPIGTLRAMLDYAAGSAGKPREAVFFWGSVQPDPGVLMYATALAYRLTPLVTVGLLGAVAAGLRGDRRRRTLVVALAAYVVLFTLFMGTGAKKFERYILPAVPALDVMAGVGLVWGADAIGRALAPSRPGESDRGPSADGATTRVGRGALASGDVSWWRRGTRPAYFALLALVLVQGATVVARSPYYLAAYNPLLGGGAQAARRLPVGWGEGMDLAAAYLNSLPGAPELVVATPSVGLLSPLFDGRTVKAADWQDADLVVLYVDDVQIGRPALVDEMRSSREPQHVIHVGGIDYAWIYPVGDAVEGSAGGATSGAASGAASPSDAGSADGTSASGPAP